MAQLVLVFSIFGLLLLDQAYSSNWCSQEGKDCICYHKENIIDCIHVFHIQHNGVEQYYIPLRSPNIMILNKTIQPEIAYFQDNDIAELKMNNILPGSEQYIREIDFSHNRISTIGSKTFQKLENLKVLKLGHNKLSTISREAFIGGPNWNLQELNLEYNPLKNIKEIFTEMPNLEKLVLDGVKNIDLKETFSGNNLMKLKFLSLQNCSLYTLPDDVFEDLTSLEVLLLSNNSFASVPKAVQDIPSLKELRLSNTQIAEIQSNAFKYDHNLAILELESNLFLHTIHYCAFCGLSSLQTLTLKESSQLYHIHDKALGDPLHEKHSPSMISSFNVENAKLAMLPASLIVQNNDTKLNLGGNPWDCTCLFKPFLKYIDYSSSVIARCKTPRKWRGRSLESLANSQFCQTSPYIPRILFIFMILILAISVYFLTIHLLKCYQDYNFSWQTMPITYVVLHNSPVINDDSVINENSSKNQFY